MLPSLGLVDQARAVDANACLTNSKPDKYLMLLHAVHCTKLEKVCALAGLPVWSWIQRVLGDHQHLIQGVHRQVSHSIREGDIGGGIWHEQAAGVQHSEASE